jgi:hypothetical protein
MNDLLRNKLIWVVGIILLFNLSLFAFTKVIAAKVKAEVISELQKDYSPSPYGPGLDPDKTQASYFELRKTSSNNLNSELISANALMNQEALVWRGNWEADRGFSD